MGQCPQSSEPGSEIVINSGDRLTIETINAFAQLIRQGLAAEATTVVVEFEPAMEMDITALQVLCSACHTAAARGKRFIHRGQPPKALLDLSAAAGAERREPCSTNNTFCFRQFGGERKWQS